MGWLPYLDLTDAAAKVLSHAEDLAQQLNQDAVRTEQILLALAAYNRGPAIDLLRACGLDLAGSVAELPYASQQPLRPSKRARLPLDPQALHLLAYGKEEGRAIGLDYLGTEHLLLGLLRLGDSMAAEFFSNRGITLEVARARLQSLYEKKEDIEES